ADFAFSACRPTPLFAAGAATPLFAAGAAALVPVPAPAAVPAAVPAPAAVLVVAPVASGLTRTSGIVLSVNSRPAGGAGAAASDDDRSCMRRRYPAVIRVARKRTRLSWIGQMWEDG